jgi:penicillin-binding protein 2
MRSWGRLQALQAATVIVFALFAVQLARLQLVDGISYSDSGATSQLRTISVEAPRGLIFDRNGTALARNVPRFSVVAIPGRLPAEFDDRRSLLLAVERETHVPLRTLELIVANGLASSDPFAPITVRTDLDATDAVQMRAALAGLPEITVSATAVREYSGGDLIPRILGYVGAIGVDGVATYLDAGYPLNAQVGRAGIEQQYEATLRGQPGRRLVRTDFAGQELETLGELAATPGDDLTLSIDLRLQSSVARALADGIAAGLAAIDDDEQQREAAGAAVVLDVRSGEVLALVSLPSYDVNIFASTARSEELERLLTDAARPLVQRAYMEVLPPGSTFKTVTGLAALQEGIATPETRITSRGSITVQDEYDPEKQYIYRDWAVLGTLDFYGGIAMSSDIYYYYLSGGYSEDGERLFDGLGPDLLASYARAASLGEPTGLDLPGEASGQVPDPQWKRDALDEPWVLGDTYTFGIGQGYLTATPLQMAVAVAAIANDGDVLTPRVVKSITTDRFTIETPQPNASRLPVDAEHLTVMREAMRRAAMPGGTADSAAPASITIGGKTGTAEFGLRRADGEFETHGWFTGFAPYEEPEIAVAVFLKHGIGGTHAAPVARSIFETYAGLQAEVTSR